MSKRRYAEDLSGYGSYLHGGRWSPKGVYAIHTAMTKSLAYLECLVHQIDPNNWPPSMSLTTLEVREEGSILLPQPLPSEWKTIRYQPECQQLIPQYFDAETLGLMLPSVIVPGENNLILNPKMKDFESLVMIISIEEIRLDERFGPKV